MTTYFPFVPNVQAPFQFQPTLDGQSYAATVVWNLYGQRWYLSVNQLTGTPVFFRALIGSPDGVSIESASWSFGTATVVTSQPHLLPVGETVSLAISGCAPDAYNGQVLALIVDEVTLTYNFPADPGDATQLGIVVYNINLAGGYFDSTFVFRASSQAFEVSP